MFISREVDYALRTVRVLHNSGRLNVKEICESEAVPLAYAYKILKKLEKAGIVKSFRGSNGGYEQQKLLADISMYDIYVAVDGVPYINECMMPNFKCPNMLAGKRCAIHYSLQKMQKDFIESMQNSSLEDMMQTENIPDTSAE